MRNEKLTNRREESGEEGKTADEWSQTHYDLGVSTVSDRDEGKVTKIQVAYLGATSVNSF